MTDYQENYVSDDGEYILPDYDEYGDDDLDDDAPSRPNIWLFLLMLVLVVVLAFLVVYYVFPVIDTWFNPPPPPSSMMPPVQT